MRVVTLGALPRPPIAVSMGGLGDGEAQARNTRAVTWFVGISALVVVGGFWFWRAASR